MRRVPLCLTVLMLVASAHGQVPGGCTAQGPASTAPSRRMHTRGPSPSTRGGRFKPDIPLNAPIITLDGVCAPSTASPGKSAPAKPQAKSAPAKSAQTCKTVITRGQLDAMVDAVNPGAPSKARQQFALNYARLLAATQIAEEQHLDQSPEIARQIQVQQILTRLEVLTDSLLQGLGKVAERIPSKDVEAYYKQYASTFEQAEVQRLAIPLSAPTESGKPVDPAAAKAKMEELRERVVEGREFDDLQAQAYSDLRIKGPTPPTKINLTRRGSLSSEEEKVFDMDLGATTPVFEDEGVIMILRVTSRQAQNMDEVRAQIEAVLLQQRLQEQLHDATKGVTAEFNLKYLDAPSQPELFPASVMTPGAIRRGMLSSLHVQP